MRYIKLLTMSFFKKTCANIWIRMQFFVMFFIFQNTTCVSFKFLSPCDISVKNGNVYDDIQWSNYIITCCVCVYLSTHAIRGIQLNWRVPCDVASINCIFCFLHLLPTFSVPCYCLLSSSFSHWFNICQKLRMAQLSL